MAGDDRDDNEGHWVSISAAARALGITRAAIRGRIRRGTLPVRRQMVGNREWYRVRLPEPYLAPEPVGHQVPERAELREQVARLEERLTATEEARAELRAGITRLEDQVADLQRERDRLLGLLEAMLAEHPGPPRPGPLQALRRWWRGEQ